MSLTNDNPWIAAHEGRGAGEIEGNVAAMLHDPIDRNNEVHNRHFPGMDPPSGVRGSAYEPSDWNRGDIRSTWIKSVGR